MFVGNKVVRKIGNLIGRMGMGSMASRRPHANVAMPLPKEASGPLEEEYTIRQRTSGVPLTIVTMTPDQLEARRIAQVEAADFSRGVHESIMLVCLRAWLIVGPMAYVALTSGEIAYLFSLIAPSAVSYLIWGGALMIDITLMFVTFALARHKQRVHEMQSASLEVPAHLRRTLFGLTWSWLGLAFVSLVGQTAYLVLITSQSRLPLVLFYGLIATRVLGFTLCDAVTAFWLSQLGTRAEEVARIDELKGRLHLQIARSAGEHRKAAAKAKMEIVKLDLEIERERRWAAFHAELDRLMIAETLSRQRARLIEEPPTQTDIAELPD
jgi:hypothetical protein